MSSRAAKLNKLLAAGKSTVLEKGFFFCLGHSQLSSRLSLFSDNAIYCWVRMKTPQASVKSILSGSLEMYTDTKASHMPQLCLSHSQLELLSYGKELMVIYKLLSERLQQPASCGLHSSHCWRSARLLHSPHLVLPLPRSRKQFYSRRSGGASPMQGILTYQILGSLWSFQENSRDPTCNWGSWGTKTSRKAQPLTGAA